jgi:tryptophan synthase beta chain
VGGGSNAIGLFTAFVDDAAVAIFGAEAAGLGLETEHHAATMQKGSSAVFHGMHSLFLQNEDGQITEPYSISAGLDYPGVGPEHAHLQHIQRVKYMGVTDEEALQAFELLTKEEGIIPAFESSHALALALRQASEFAPGANLLVNLSGRGDKDLSHYMQHRGIGA